ncbi:MAG: sigma-70 family RNA polymerase sigma factor [Clostridiales bacterium]|nr:sigma-70 family RNA polymerase sigma factor [Candidatus Equinaster intestinalis]
MDDFINDADISLSDEDLAILIKSGDETKLHLLIRRYLPLIKAKSRKFCIGGDNDDFLQEGLMALYSAAKVFNPDISSFKSFASVCIERTLVSYFRKNFSKKQIPKEALVYFEDDSELFSEETPESLIIEKEESDLLTLRIKKELSRQEYNILVMFLAGNSYESIANKFGLTLKAVNNSMYRARKKIELLK